MNTELLTLANTINAARIEANAHEITAPQSGVYGQLADALEATLTLILGSAELGAAAYQNLLDGATITEAVEWVKATLPAIIPNTNTNAADLARHIANTLNITITESASRVTFCVEELELDTAHITEKQATEIERCIAADLKAGK